jgi:16S rRNA (guanine527-N7)-methyltransferase
MSILSENVEPYLAIARNNGLQLSPVQSEQLVRYVDLLREWNAKVNLVSRKDEEGIWPNHILHSLSLLFALSIPDELRIADIGSGGGLPGIPIAIALPGVHVTLIESIRKKCTAVEDIIKRLSLSNVSVINSRAEDLARTPALAHTFNLVTARAVAPLDELVAWSVPLAGQKRSPEIRSTASSSATAYRAPILLAMKGGELKDEIQTAQKKYRAFTFHQLPIRFAGIESTTLTEKFIIISELHPQR